MYIVTVFPLSRHPFKERLSYWSAHPFKPGSIINAPLRGRTIPSLVESVSPASDVKTSVKNASFMTKKIEKGDERMLVERAAIRAAEKTAEYFVSPLGTVLRSLISEAILSAPLDVALKIKKETTKKENSSDTPDEASIEEPEGKDELRPVPEILTLQSHDDDRFSSYTGIVREEFARKKSVIIVAPTVVIATDIANILKKGIEEYVITLHGGLSKKKQIETWSHALSESHSVVIITTPSFMSIPRHDADTIIIERESSRAYISPRSPFIDFRSYAEYYARERGSRLIYGDTLLRIETLYRREHGEIGDLFAPSFRLEVVPKSLIVDMADKAHKEKEGFKILSEELISMIEYATKKSLRMFVFCARRGLSPQTVCGDCGLTVACDQCEAPVVLHNSKKEEGRFFLCHHCGKKRSAAERCKKCNSWKLVTLGIGIDTVSEELKRRFPKMPIMKIDRDMVSTDKQARKIIEEYESTPGAILLGTETALAFLNPMPYVAIASLDSLFSLPDFRLNERICHILLRLMQKTTEYLLVQTRNASTPILSQITRGALSDFYRKELDMRQMLNYPPFSVFIKITIEGPKVHIAEEMEKIERLLQPWPTSIFPAFIPTVRGHAMLHLLLSVSPDMWPDENLVRTLASLPPAFVVKVNPESLL